MPLTGESNFLQALGWAVLNSLWQMAFLWIIFQVLLSFGFKKPSIKGRLAGVMITTGFIWFLVTLFNHWLVDPAAVKKTLFAIGSFEKVESGWNDQLTIILPYASITYLLLLIVPFTQFIRNYRFVQIIRHHGLSKCHVDLRIFVQRFSARMGIRRRVHIYISELITSPVTVGFFKPIILMPLAAINHLSTKQVEAVLLHELAHIRRHDYFFNLFINFIRTILYFNPFVKLFTKVIEREREKSCDELVMQFEYDPHGYAAALLLLEKNNMMPRMMTMAASGQKNDLIFRIEKILGMEKTKVPHMQRLGGMIAGLICIIGLNALFFFSSPVMKNGSISFQAFPSPFYNLANAGSETFSSKPKENDFKKQLIPDKKPDVVKETQTQPATLIIRKIQQANQTLDVSGLTEVAEAPSMFMTVDQRTTVMPELEEAEQEQIKVTVAATKKVLEEGQWKQVEKSIGDALLQAEKERLKLNYHIELEKVDWKNLENKLTLAYDRINWEKVNLQLGTAITAIKIDSLTKVYNAAIVDLNKVEGWMVENKCFSIPDTDLKLNEVLVQKEKLQTQLKTIISLKQRKIIHL